MKKTNEYNKWLSVWSWPYPTKYYILRPWKWFKHLFFNIRDAHNRMKYGYCGKDVWNMMEWFPSVAAPMLMDLAENCDRYPGRGEFDTYDKWVRWLKNMANKIEQTSETYYDINPLNQYEKEFEKIHEAKQKRFNELPPEEQKRLDNFFNVEDTQEEKELAKKFFDRELELSEHRQQLINEVAEELAKNWLSLWD